MTSVEFEARTARNVLIKTFETRALALAWWEDCACQFPGARLEEVTTEIWVTRRSIRRPRLELVRSGGGYA